METVGESVLQCLKILKKSGDISIVNYPPNTNNNRKLKLKTSKRVGRKSEFQLRTVKIGGNRF